MIISIRWNNPMKDPSKKKQSLIQKLNSLKEKITELEKSEAAHKKLAETLILKIAPYQSEIGGKHGSKQRIK
jgi:hypothetical protein